jgi:Ca-activated chloride channel family protein
MSSMKVRTAALWAIVGMMGSSAAAMNLPAAGRASKDGSSALTAAAGATMTPALAEPRFHADKTLSVDARLGHGSVAQGGGGETFLLASIAGGERADRATAPMNLAIVIDRSGSMRGVRLANAIAAATGIVERMRDGDRVTVVSFDDTAQVVVPPTLASVTSRAGVEAAIRSVRPGGDTCMSCGLEAAMVELDGVHGAADDPGVSPLGGEVDRAILLSDGAANRGVKDIAGLRRIAGRMRDRGCAVTTIGLDVDFDEKVMAAIATESNGHHYFVADAADLTRVFDRELDALLATVARDAELVIEPAAGVEIAEVFDRAFRREGDRVVVPLGTFGAKQEKTALLRLRVPASKVGVESVVAVSLHWHDLVSRVDDGVASGLSIAVKPAEDAQADLDPFVAARLERSRTARTLTDANLLFEQGKRDEARRALEKTADEIQASKAKASAAAKHVAAPPKPAAAMPFKDDFEAQLDAITSARSGFARKPSSASGAAVAGGGGFAAPAAPAPADIREEKAAVKKNQSNATELGL